MPTCTNVLAGWDGGFESSLRRFLPFLPAGQSLTAHAGLRDLGLDSVGTVELLAKLESDYQVRFTDELLTIETFATPGVLWGTLVTLTRTTL